MRTHSRSLLLALALAAAGAPAAAQIPKLSEVPPGLPEAKHAELVRTRAVLIQRRDQLVARAQAFEAKCANVTVGSPLEAECKREQQQLEAERARYIKMANDFNAQIPVKVQLSPPIGKFSAFKGDVRIQSLDGRTVSGADLAAHTLTLGSRLTTGPDGQVTLRLLDDTTFSMGPNSAMIMDEFVYDPGKNSTKLAASITRGAFRFVSGKIAPRQLRDVILNMPAGTIGVRGTEFETTIAPDGSGEIKLFVGELEITRKLDGSKFLMKAKHSVRFDAKGVFAEPTAMR